MRPYPFAAKLRALAIFQRKLDRYAFELVRGDAMKAAVLHELKNPLTIEDVALNRSLTRMKC